jgi:hypothetical protein
MITSSAGPSRVDETVRLSCRRTGPGLVGARRWPICTADTGTTSIVARLVAPRATRPARASRTVAWSVHDRPAAPRSGAPGFPVATAGATSKTSDSTPTPGDTLTFDHTKRVPREVVEALGRPDGTDLEAVTSREDPGTYRRPLGTRSVTLRGVGCATSVTESWRVSLVASPARDGPGMITTPTDGGTAAGVVLERAAEPSAPPTGRAPAPARSNPAPVSPHPMIRRRLERPRMPALSAGGGPI